MISVMANERLKGFINDVMAGRLAIGQEIRTHVLDKRMNPYIFRSGRNGWVVVDLLLSSFGLGDESHFSASLRDIAIEHNNARVSLKDYGVFFKVVESSISSFLPNNYEFSREEVCSIVAHHYFDLVNDLIKCQQNTTASNHQPAIMEG